MFAGVRARGALNRALQPLTCAGEQRRHREANSPGVPLQFRSHLESDLIAVTSIEQCAFIGLRWGVCFLIFGRLCLPLFFFFRRIFSHPRKFGEEFAIAPTVNFSEISPPLSVRSFISIKWRADGWGSDFEAAFPPRIPRVCHI